VQAFDQAGVRTVCGVHADDSYSDVAVEVGQQPAFFIQRLNLHGVEAGPPLQHQRERLPQQRHVADEKYTSRSREDGLPLNAWCES
jgi:hypothetical protein